MYLGLCSTQLSTSTCGLLLHPYLSHLAEAGTLVLLLSEHSVSMLRSPLLPTSPYPVDASVTVPSSSLVPLSPPAQGILHPPTPSLVIALSKSGCHGCLQCNFQICIFSSDMFLEFNSFYLPY